jgi:spermidine synthase
MRDKVGASGHFLLFAAFAAGASVMSLELCASRVLAPAFGSSIYVWGSLIGVVLVALSAGYYFGGRLADRGKDAGAPYKAILYAGLAASLVPTVGYPFAVFSMLMGMVWGPVAAAFILFFVPMALLSTVSPMAIKSLTRDISGVGGSAGTVYAVSTAGSIVGTFATAFALLPYLGTRLTLLFNAAVLFIIGAAGLWERRYTLTSVFLLTSVIAAPYSPPGMVYRTESAYNIISVWERDGSRVMKLNWDSFDQSRESVSGAPNLEDYYGTFLLGPLLNDGRRVLWVGLAGGTSAKGMLQLYNLSIDAVEIDPKVVEVAHKYFGLGEGEGISITVMDGRQFLRGAGEYDIVNVDVFNAADIPFHMATAEFFAEASQHMSPDGIIMMNVLSLKGDRRLRDAVASTMRSQFPSVYTLDVGWNSVVIGSKRRRTVEDLTRGLAANRNPVLEPVVGRLGGRITEFNSPGGVILTDDRSNIEELAFNQQRLFI